MKPLFAAALAASLLAGTASFAQQSPTGQSSGGYTGLRPGEIAPQQRVILRGYATRDGYSGVPTGGRVSSGYAVPDSVELRSFPDSAYGEVPAARNYRYYSTGGNVVLVDPGSRRVVDVID